MVFEKLKLLICEQLDVEEEKVTEESSFEDLGADSIDLLDFITSVEEEFDIEIPDESTDNLKTVGDVVKYIEKLI